MVPPKDWGVAALTEFADPRMTVLEKGVGALLLPTTSSKPEGVDTKFRPTVCGSRRILLVSIRPPASVTVSLISRCDGYSWSGAEKDPVMTPEKL